MCGICGLWTTPDSTLSRRTELAVAGMTGSLEHRGPDTHGTWHDQDSGIALGHRRLAILDLSPDGHQPMVSASGRFAMVFNGEIYNFRTMREMLEAEGCSFRGHSDTEVLLAACEAWGVESTLERCVGMYAFAIFDRRDRRLTLARDRLGIKPLYYGWCDGDLAFASEARAFRRLPTWRGSIDRGALDLYLRHSMVPAPHTIYEGVYKLEPGAMIEFAGSGARPSDFSPFAVDAVPGGPRRYWSAVDTASRGLDAAFAGDEQEALSELETLVRNAVRCRLVSDVPLGAFLSGGIDSSLVVAIMQQEAAGAVKTFSIGFQEADYDEAPHARAVAEHLGTDHTEERLTAAQALEVVPRLGALTDEPFADSSLIPTYLVSAIARRRVTVALSGDGGDELFAGYDRYQLSSRAWHRLARLPRSLRGLAARAGRAVPIAAWDRLVGDRRAMSSPLRSARLSGDRIHKLAGIVEASTYEAFYRDFIAHWPPDARPVTGGVDRPRLDHPGLDAAPPLLQARLSDLAMYLPDDVLTKVDRASMAVSLEARVPLLDHRIVEFALTLPPDLLVVRGHGKHLLRTLVNRFVPPEIMDRPKQGFGVPIGAWLRGPLRDWAEDLLAADRLRAQGYLDVAAMRTIWREHLDGRRDWKYRLWDALMFQEWLDAS